MINLMLDIETLGTTPGYAIISIAAVPFGFGSDSILHFYQKADSKSNLEIGLKFSTDTLDWWAKQCNEAYIEAFSGKTHIREVLYSFHKYCKEFDSLRVWGNGAAFDVPLLEAAFKAVGLEPPWHYTDSMCYRTMKNLYPQVPFIRTGTAHNALEDAKSQAAHLEKIFHFMGYKNASNT